jgi:quercetin dioxygenase-like cupin family protein
VLRLLAATLLLVPSIPGAAFAQSCPAIPVDTTDGVLVAPESHKVLYEDQDVRVLSVVNLPHTTEPMHTHARPSLFLVLEDHPYKILFPERKPFSPPVQDHAYAMYFPPNPPHAIENDGEGTFRALRFELKHPGCGPAPAPLGAADALLAAPGNHRILFENDEVRVLDVTVPAHSVEPMHTHAWPSIVYFDTPGNLRFLTPANPSPRASRIPANLCVRLAPESSHAIENLGDTPFHLFRVELKHALPPSKG